MVTKKRTLVSALADLPRREGRGFRFVGADRQERFFSYEAMHREALRRGAHLCAMGLKKGDRVALVIPEGHEFVLTFLGAAVAGLVPVPIFPRATFKAVDAYIDVVAHIVSAAGARVLLTQDSLLPHMEKVRARDGALDTVALCETAFSGDPPPFQPPPVDPDDLCFLQFTSGSTAHPKGVMVTHTNLVANSEAFLGPQGLNRNDADVGISWLPLFHDMGLIGFILGTIICDIPVVILPTASFARTPRLWLETIHKYRGSITYAPNFAYQLVTKRLRDRDIEALDLSCLRVAGCGAEPIRAQTLRDFARRLAEAGFDGERAFLPSYGMAEATLAITFHQLGSPLVVDRVDPAQMKSGRAVPIDDPEANALELVSCGVPFPGHGLKIVTENGAELPERHVGEIIVEGPSVTPGYYENPSATQEAITEGWLHTGDLGYVADGNVYICGRIKDLIIIHGANHYPQDLEWAVGELQGVRRGNVVAFSVMREGIEELVMLAEGNRADAAKLRDRIGQVIAERFGLSPSDVAIVPVGTLPKTSSGKAQRRKARDLYEDGALPIHPTDLLDDQAS